MGKHDLFSTISRINFFIGIVCMLLLGKVFSDYLLVYNLFVKYSIISVLGLHLFAHVTEIDYFHGAWSKYFIWAIPSVKFEQ